MGRPEIVPDLLGRRAEHAPDAVALAVRTSTSDDTAVGAPRGRLTFGDWEERSSAAARGLARSGVGAGDRVGLLFDNARWLDSAVAYLAVLKVGAVAVPIAGRFPAMDAERVIGHSRPTVVVCPPDLLPDAAAWTSIAVAELESGESTEPFQPAVGPGEVAELLYPEGAMRAPVARGSTHGDLMAAPSRPPRPPASPGSFVHAFPFGTAAGQEAMRLPLRADGVVAVVLDEYDADRLRSVVAEERATGCGLTPAMARLLVDSGAGHDADLRHLGHLVLSRPPGDPGLMAALTEAFPRVEVHCLDPSLSIPTVEGDTAPLAASQDGMVWHEQFTPGSFNLSPPVRRLRGPLDVGALTAALTEIVRRHAALRTRFSIVDGRAVQVFPPPTPVELPVVDLSDLPEPDRMAALGRIVSDARSRPFDLVVTPPFEPLLVRLGADDHVMVLRTHHAVYDDWSVGLFRRELSALYTAFLAGEPSPLTELAVALPEVVRAQSRALEGETGEAERSFWRRELEGAPLSVQLPIDDPDRPEGSPHRAPAPLSLEIPPEVAGALRRLARSQRATVFMVLLAGFGVLVQRFTGQDDLLVSTLAANRSATETEDLIGCFGKKVLVRVRLTGDPELGDLIVRTRRALMGALAHQGLAYESVVQEVLGPDAAAHGLAPQIALKFQAAIPPRQRLDLPGLTTSGIDLPRPTAAAAHFMAGDDDAGRGRHDVPGWGSGLYLGAFLGLSVVDTGDGLRLTTEGVFHAPEVERLLSHFGILLADIAADPSRRVSELAVASGPGTWLAGPRGPGGAQADVDAVHEAFERQARRAPDRPAVAYGDEAVTFAQLDRRADGLADRLRAAGVGAEAPVGLLMPPGVDLVVAALAIWKAGGAVVPIDPSAPPEQASQTLRDCGCRVVVADGDLPGTTTVRAGGRDPALCGALTTHDVANSPKVVNSPNLLAWVHHVAPAAGVEIDHRSLLSTAAALHMTVYPPEVDGLRVCAPGRATSAAFVRGLLALTQGHTIHLTPTDPSGGPQALVSLVGAGLVDVVDATPGELTLLLDHGLQAALDERSARDARPQPPAPVLLVVASTTAMSPELWSAWRNIRGARAHFLYGPPEYAFAATTCAAAEGPVRPSIGRPITGLRAGVLDSRDRPVPIRALGELALTGPCLARGYRNRPEMTAERFGPVGQSGTGGRLFRTGQRARRMPDGTIELVATARDHVDLRGFLVDPGRVESALAGCPGVEAVKVAAEGGRLVAQVFARDGEVPPTLGQLRRWLWKRLPGFAWPAAMTVAGVAPGADDGRLDEVALLAAAWTDTSAQPAANYWQSFAFIDALAEADASGAGVPAVNVTRNRTLETLAADMAATDPSRGQEADSL